jgi:hypothetical protein
VQERCQARALDLATSRSRPAEDDHKSVRAVTGRTLEASQAAVMLLDSRVVQGLQLAPEAAWGQPLELVLRQELEPSLVLG